MSGIGREFGSVPRPWDDVEVSEEEVLAYARRVAAGSGERYILAYASSAECRRATQREKWYADHPEDVPGPTERKKEEKITGDAVPAEAPWAVPLPEEEWRAVVRGKSFLVMREGPKVGDVLSLLENGKEVPGWRCLVTYVTDRDSPCALSNVALADGFSIVSFRRLAL